MAKTKTPKATTPTTISTGLGGAGRGGATTTPSTKGGGNPVLYGSVQSPYRLAIIGGGPAGTAILIRAARLGLLGRLLGPSTENGLSTGGVIILEKGSEEMVGSGILGDYLINSNTSLGKFASNTLEDKPDGIPAEVASGTFLMQLRQTKSAAQVEAYGEEIGPLPLAGAYLNQLGRALKAEMDRHQSSSCLCSAEVTSLQQLEGNQGWAISINAEGIGRIDHSPKDGPLISYLKEGHKIYAHRVVLACGGRQGGPEFKGQYQGIEDKLVLSDRLLRLGGLEMLQEKVDSSQEKRGEEQPVKICIIGGSHSGFSSAWICLTRMEPECFTEGSITILHKNAIKVFYSSKKEATDAGYTDYSKANVNKRGQVYPFSGLRGDARELYQAVMSGKETRVRLLDTSSVAANTSNAAHKAVSQVIAEADVVVWACGYGANLFPILTPSGEELALRVSSSGQVHVEDGSANVLERWSGAVIPSLHAMGLGFGFRSNHDGEEARSDGVGIYQKKGATIILGSIFGTQVYGGYNTWAEREEANAAIKLSKKKKGQDDDSSCSSQVSSPRARLASGTTDTRSQSLVQSRRSSNGAEKLKGVILPNAPTNPRVTQLALSNRRKSLSSSTTATTSGRVSSRSTELELCRCQVAPTAGLNEGSTSTATASTAGSDPSSCKVCGGVIKGLSTSSKTTRVPPASHRQSVGGSSRRPSAPSPHVSMKKASLKESLRSLEKALDAADDQGGESGSARRKTQRATGGGVTTTTAPEVQPIAAQRRRSSGGGTAALKGPRQTETLHLPPLAG